MTLLVLNQADRSSGLWRRIAAHLQQELATLREKNDSMRLDATETAEIRGEIAAIKKLLALADPALGVGP